MKYEVIMEKGSYALILRGYTMEEFAVVYGLDKEHGEWGHTVYYVSFDKFSPCTKEEALLRTFDYFLWKTLPYFIPRCRLEELATMFKDKIMENDEELALEYFNYECSMTEEEKTFFGIESEDENEEV